MIAALRARRQRKAVRRSMRCSVLLAGLLFCMQMSCSGGANTSEGFAPTPVLSHVIPASDDTLAYQAGPCSL